MKISIGRSRKDTNFKVQEWSWEQLTQKLSKCVHTSETMAEYQAMTKDQRGEVKDVGGFVGGALKQDGPRKKETLLDRCLVTLDIDYGQSDTIDKVTAALNGYAWCSYTTHTHTPKIPRLRLVIPLSRPVTPEEYIPIARRIAEDIDIRLFDNTTDEAERLMYWPSAPKDGPFDFHPSEGKLLNPDEVLGTYEDWHNRKEWPLFPSEMEAPRATQAKAADPTTKRGVVGAFCSVYNIHQAIDTFLSGNNGYPLVYTPDKNENRYKYVLGEGVAGLSVYDRGNRAQSRHATDPAVGKNLCSFDLVRIHLFGNGDDGQPGSETWKRMVALCESDAKVSALLDAERKAEVNEVFKDALTDTKGAPQSEAKPRKDKTPQQSPNIDFSAFFKPTTEATIKDEESKMPEGLVTGYILSDVNSEVSEKTKLTIAPGVLTGIAGATNHGKTVLLLNILLNVARRYPTKKFLLITYEERANKMIQYLLNIYLQDLKLGRTDGEYATTNRTAIRNYYKYGNTRDFNPEVVEEFEKRKNLFYKTFIDSGRILVKHGKDLDIKNLCRLLQYTQSPERCKEANSLGGVFIDYFQFIPSAPGSHANQRTEELKSICQDLNTTAIATGLPITLAVQFNREVQCPDDLHAGSIGEAGDIERILSEIYGVWDLRKKAGAFKTDKEESVKKYQGKVEGIAKNEWKMAKEKLWGAPAPSAEELAKNKSALLIRVLKGRDVPVGSISIWPYYPQVSQRVFPTDKEEKNTIITPEWELLDDFLPM